MKKIFLYLFVTVAVQIAVSLLLAAGWNVLTGESPSGEDGRMLVASTIIYTLIVITLFLALKWTPVSGNYIKSKPWSVLAWSALVGVGMLIPSEWLTEQLPALPDRLEQAMKNIINTPGGYAAIGLLAPLCEEIVFRGAILRTLLSIFRSKAWAAIALSALLFALIHANPAQMPYAFVVGLLLGWMYWRTGSIVPGTLLHVVNNTGVYLTDRLLPQADTLQDIFGSEINVLKAVVCSLLILLPALWQLHLRMKKAETEGSDRS